MILDGAEELSRGEYTWAERSLQSVYADLRRISSDRHYRLAGFVCLALLSCADKDYSEAVTLLLASVRLFESHAVAASATTRAPLQLLDFQTSTQHHLCG
jgi:hypothetical protein